MKEMPKLRARSVVWILLTFLIGFLLGATSIHRPIPGAPAELPPARHPWSAQDVLGLIGSLGIRAMAGHLEAIPSVLVETDRTFALALPAWGNRVHYVIVPKKDIRDVGQVSVEDQAYLADAFLVAGRLAEKERLKGYRLITNGGDLQTVAYLHFHLIGMK